MRRNHLLLLIVAMCGGLALLGYYTHHLFREELRDWQELTVQFEDVGGLKENDEVQIKGRTLGRVKTIELFQDMQVATLQIEPGTVVHRDYAIKIVPKSAIGQKVVRIDPGTPAEPAVIPGEHLKGELFVGLGGGDSSPARRRALAQSIREFADLTLQAQDPESGGVGQLLFDRTRQERLAQGLTDLEQLWRDLDEALAEIDAGRGAAGPLTVSGETLLAFRETIATFRGSFSDLRRGVGEADRGEGLPGRLLGDPAFARSLEETLARQAAFLRATREREGTLGRFQRPEVHELALHQVEALHDRTLEAEDDRGLLGVLSSPTYDEHVSAGLEGIADATAAIESSPLVRSPEVRDSFEDAAADIQDRVRQFQRVVEGLDRNLPARSSFSGAVFAIF